MDTHVTHFDPKSLPGWAQSWTLVVELAKQDLGYRAQLHQAETKQMRWFLIRQAEKWDEMRANT